MKTEKISIIIADDHHVVREGTRELLQKENDLEVVGEAVDGEEAVQLVKDLKPDVAILDVSMPKLNGIEATRQIKDISPGTAVLILTAYGYDQYVFALETVNLTDQLFDDAFQMPVAVEQAVVDTVIVTGTDCPFIPIPGGVEHHGVADKCVRFEQVIADRTEENIIPVQLIHRKFHFQFENILDLLGQKIQCV